MVAECEKCGGTGWMRIVTDGIERVTRCPCGTQARLQAEQARPGGFTPLGAIAETSAHLRGVVEDGDRRIAELIQRRRGQVNAITIEQIALSLWPGEWSGAMVSPEFRERKRASIIRGIKAAVERLRRVARLPIAATKTPPYGYFIPVTAEETKDAHDRYFHEGIMSIKLSQIFRRDADLVRELEGQLKLQ